MRALPRLLLAVALALPAAAFAPRTHPRVEATAAIALKAPLRETVRVTGQVPSQRQHAWDDFRASAGDRWTATWDAATGVPSRIWGGSLYVPGSSSTPAIAEAAARALIEAHAALLAPGVTPDDLVLVADHDDGHIRSIGFMQRHRGVAVLDGQVSVRFMNDRIYVLSSQILPDVDVDPAPARTIDVVETARTATIADLGLPAAAYARAAGDPVIVPLVGDDAIFGYRLAVPVDVVAGSAGAWRVFADPTTGAPLVRRDARAYDTGTLTFDVPNLYPEAGRIDLPAQRAHVTVDGTAITTGDDGTLTWSTTPGSMITSVSGDLVNVQNTRDPGPLEVTATLPVTDGQTTRWSFADDGPSDAQLSAFVRIQVAKGFARTLNPDPNVTTWLDTQMPVNVDIDDQCNAYYQPGDSTFGGQATTNFFAASTSCENTARIGDVIYHEFGHGVHDHSVIPGVGLFGADFSEGAADFFAVLITGDPDIGRGFFFNDMPLRQLDPPGYEWSYPRDVGEIHQTGLIFGGTFWDLRSAAIAELGQADGEALTEKLYVAALQRATDTTSVLIEVLAADDDDGDLSNGTPHECLIRTAFAAHGLRTVTASVDAPGQVATSAGSDTATVALHVGGVSATCGDDTIVESSVTWAPRADSRTPTAGSTDLADSGGDVFTGQMPLPDPGDIVRYHFDITFADGTMMQLPDNAGDPDYDLYRGDVVPIYCTDFETDPFAAGDKQWTHDGTLEDGTPTDLWQWGAPTGAGGDPAAAYSGTNVVGLALTGDGMYPPSLTTALHSPTIDVGKYSDVRLQYRRWLGVEDAFYDQASIYANGELAWQNFASTDMDTASQQTRDHEWTFRDVPLSSHITDGTVKLDFELKSDPGLEFGGWTLDDVCIVADPNAVCGNGTIEGAEQCDNGSANSSAPDACRDNCQRATCGDGVVDSNEECDDGNTDNGDGCSSICTLPDTGGCCSTNDDPTSALVPGLLVAGLLLGWRRRARA